MFYKSSNFRKVLLAALIASTAISPVVAQKVGKAGGIGSQNSTYKPNGEPTGGTYDIDGTTGAATLGPVTVNGNITVTGTVTATNVQGTNTGDQTSVTGNAGTATKFATPRTINGVSFDGTANIVINAIDSTARLAASSNLSDIANTATARQNIGAAASGANTDITSITGNAASASKLATARTLTTTGDVASSLTFDGSINASGTATLATVNGSVGTYGSTTTIPVITTDAKGRITSVSTVPVSSGSPTFKGLTDVSPLTVPSSASSVFGATANAGGTITSLQYTATTATSAGAANAGNLPILNGSGVLDNSFIGTIPLTQGGTGANSASAARAALGVTPTGADTSYLWRSNNLSEISNPSVARFNIGAAATGANTDITSITGSAAKLTTARTIGIAGDVSGSTTFDGSANATVTVTLPTVNGNVGTFGAYGTGNTGSTLPIFTVDAKGRVTSVSTYSLGSSSNYAIGITGNTIPLLSGNNNWGGTQAFGGAVSFAPATSTAASFNIPGATGIPTSANKGDVWASSGSTLYYRDGSLTHLFAFTDSNITGSAATLTTPRSITGNGDTTWSTTFDGSANVVATTTLATVNSNVGTFGNAGTITVPILTVNAKGLTTAAGAYTLANSAMLATAAGGDNLSSTLATSAFAQSLTTVVPIGVTSGSITLTSTQASSDTLILSGNLSSNLSLYFGSGSAALFNRQYRIINNTTGAYTVTVYAAVTSPSGSVTITQGKAASILINGNSATVIGNDYSNAPIDLSSPSVTGTLAAARFPALTGDVVTSAGSLTTSLASVNSNVGTFGSASYTPVITTDAKGRITAISTVATSGGTGGTAANGIPSGGTTGQVLKKNSSADYDTSWLSLGTASSYNTGTTGGTIGLLNGNNTYGGTSTFSLPIVGSVTGSAATLTTARNLALTGDITGTASFDGSANVSTTTTLATVNSNVGTFGSGSAIPVITTDAKGRITAVTTASFSAGGGGTVTGVSVATANGVSGTVANASTTPAITLSLGAITPSSVAATSTVTASNISGSTSGTNTGDQTITLTGDVTGSGTGSFVSTLATVNSNVGTYGSASAVPVITTDGKGRITSVSTAALSLTGSQTNWHLVSSASPYTFVDGDAVIFSSASGPIAITPPSTFPAGHQILAYVPNAISLTVGGNTAGTGPGLLRIFSTDGTSGGIFSEMLSDSSGNIATATKLQTPRTIATTGDVTSSLTFDGSANASGSATLATVNPNVGTFGSATTIPVITTDAKGRITSVSSTAVTATSTGTIPATTLTGAFNSGVSSYSLTSWGRYVWNPTSPSASNYALSGPTPTDGAGLDLLIIGKGAGETLTVNLGAPYQFDSNGPLSSGNTLPASSSYGSVRYTGVYSSARGGWILTQSSMYLPSYQGTLGQVLTSYGAGTSPYWNTPNPIANFTAAPTSGSQIQPYTRNYTTGTASYSLPYAQYNPNSQFDLYLDGTSNITVTSQTGETLVTSSGSSTSKTFTAAGLYSFTASSNSTNHWDITYTALSGGGSAFTSLTDVTALTKPVNSSVLFGYQVNSSGVITGLNQTVSTAVGGTSSQSGYIPKLSSSGTLDTSFLPLSGVTAGTYGGSSTALSLGIDQYGRISSLSTAPITLTLPNCSLGVFNSGNTSYSVACNGRTVWNQSGAASASTYTISAYAGHGTPSDGDAIDWQLTTGVETLSLNMAGNYIYENGASLSSNITIAPNQTVRIRGAYSTALGGWVLNKSSMFVPAAGTTGQVLTKNSSTDYDYSWATASGGGGSSTLVQVYNYTGSGQTWTKPSGAKFVRVWIVGGGNGGNGGISAAVSTASAGGAGGASSYVFDLTLSADIFPSTATVTVGAGGAGGAGSSNTTINYGGNGGASSVIGGSISLTGGGTSSNNPIGLTISGLTSGVGYFSGYAGATTSSGNNGNAGSNGNLNGSGGSGGGVAAANTPKNGGGGGYPTLGPSLGGQITVTANGYGESTAYGDNAGANGSAPVGLFLGGSAGGGGGACIGTCTTPGNGGSGGIGSGGGGGGNTQVGASTTAAGAGGAGGNGRVIIVTTF